MNPEQQRIAIAEACGWKETEAWLDGRRCFERADSNAGWDFDSLPDYINDLNAMHEAEKVLKHEQQIDYSRNIGKMVTSHLPASRSAWMDYELINATAEQRSEAFLRTIGKWKECK